MPFGQAKTQGFNAPQILNFQVASLVFNKNGLFFYNGTPGPGNPPVMSMVLSTVTTDPYGNTIYDYLTVGQFGVSPIRFVPGNPSFIEFVVPGSWHGLPTIASQAGSSATLFLESGSDTTGLDTVVANLQSGIAGSGANGFLGYIDGNGGSNTQLEWGFQGAQLPVVASMSAVAPGTGTSPTNPAGVEGWHVVTPDAGWNTLAGYPTISYRLKPDGDVEFSGALAHTAFTTSVNINGSNPLPSAYRPSNTHVLNIGNGFLGNVARVEYRSTGILVAIGNAATGTTYQNAELDVSCRLS